MPRWKEGTPEAVMKLWEWQHGGATHFTAKLFELLGKADPENLDRLALGFPQEVWTWQRWRGSENPETFFEQFFEGPGGAANIEPLTERNPDG